MSKVNTGMENESESVSKITLIESDLADGLKPIRGHFLSQIIYYLFESNLYWTLSENESDSIQELADSGRFSHRRLSALMYFLKNEGLVSIDQSNIPCLTKEGKQYEKLEPWYRLLIGGYGNTLASLSKVMCDPESYAARNGSEVGIGSCGISQHDALPMTIELLNSTETHVDKVIDIGCGDGSFLVDLCRRMSSVSGIGVDPEPVSVQNAIAIVKDSGLEDRVTILNGSALSLPKLDSNAEQLCILTAFVMQEVLEQEGRDCLKEMIKSIFNEHPNAYWVVIEVDDRALDPETMSTDLALGYYNPYYFIHHITEQKLESISFWEDLFKEAGANVLKINHPDTEYDSLNLKTGFLLSRKEQ